MKLNQNAPPAQGDPTYPKNWPSEKITPAHTRFAARFRIAKAFKEVSFSSGIHPSTAATYSALVRYGTVYSVWEMFVGAFGLGSTKCLESLERDHPPTAVLRLIEEGRIQGGVFLKFLIQHVSHPDLKAHINAILEGKKRSAAHLGEALRHVYVHGVLTASPWGVDATRIRDLVDALSDHFISVMDEEAGDRARARLSKKKKGESGPRDRLRV